MSTPPPAYLISPGAATRRRAEQERKVWDVLDDWYLGFVTDVREMAYAALTAPVLLAAGRPRNPFAYTNILSRWRTAVRELAAQRETILPHQAISMLMESDLPQALYQQTSDMLLQSRREGWSEWRTKRALSKLLIPRRAPGVRAADPEHALWVNRIKLVARTAATANYGLTTLDELRLHDFTQARWVSHHDSKTRPTHLAANGQIQRIGSLFVVGGFGLMFPADPNGPPQETLQCRCVLTGVR